MDKTVKEIKTTIPTAFGSITRKTTYYSFPVKIEGGVYINERSMAENSYVLDEITKLLMNGQTSSEIEIDGQEVFYDILLKFFDADGRQILPKRMEAQYLREIIRSAILEIDVDECLVGRRETEIIMNQQKIIKNE